MIKRFKTALSLGLLFVLPASIGVAQSGPEKMSDVEAIRSELVSAHQKTRELAEQNKRLKSKLISLQLEVQRSEKEIKKLEKLHPDRVNPTREQSAVFSERNEGLHGITENDPLVQEAQEIYLSGQIMDLPDEQKLRELYLYDLQFQKQELQLDIEELAVRYQDIEKSRIKEMDGLEDEIRGMIKKENESYMKLKELEKAALAYPQEIELLRVENKRLKDTIRRLKK